MSKCMTKRTQEVSSNSMKTFKASLGIFLVIKNRLEIKELTLPLVFKREVDLQVMLHLFSSWFLGSNSNTIIVMDFFLTFAEGLFV